VGNTTDSHFAYYSALYVYVGDVYVGGVNVGGVNVGGVNFCQLYRMSPCAGSVFYW